MKDFQHNNKIYQQQQQQKNDDKINEDEDYNYSQTKTILNLFIKKKNDDYLRRKDEIRVTSCLHYIKERDPEFVENNNNNNNGLT